MHNLCSHNFYTLLLCFHRAHPSVLCKCSTSRIRSLSSECTADNIISQTQVFSTLQLVLHQPISPGGNSRITLSIFLASYKKVHKCTGSSSGVSDKLAKVPLAFAFLRMAHFLYLAFSDVAPARWVLSGPNLLASSSVNG